MYSIGDLLPLYVAELPALAPLQTFLESAALTAPSHNIDEEVLERVAAAVVRSHAHERLGVVLPGLSVVAADEIHGGDHLSVTGFNALHREGIRTFGDLAACTPARLLDIRGIGPGVQRAAVALALREICDQVLAAVGSPVLPSRWPGDLTPRPWRTIVPRLVRDPALAGMLTGGLEHLTDTTLHARGLDQDRYAQRVFTQATRLVLDEPQALLGHQMPGLTAVPGEVSASGVHTTVVQATTAAGIRTWRDLAACAPADLYAAGLPESGVFALVFAALRGLMLSASEIGSGVPCFRRTDGNRYQRWLWEEEAALPVRALLSWAEQVAGVRRLGDVLVLAPQLPLMPDEVRHSWEKTAALPVDRLVPTGESPPLDDLLAATFDCLDDRTRTVFIERELSPSPTSWTELAEHFGVSSTRITQIHSVALRRIREVIRAPRNAMLRWRAMQLRQRPDYPTAPQDDLAAQETGADLALELQEQGRPEAAALLRWIAEHGLDEAYPRDSVRCPAELDAR